MRWCILDHTGGYLCYKPGKVCKVMVTCCVLHNICQGNNIPFINNNVPTAALINSEETAQEMSGAAYGRAAQAARQTIIATFN